MQDDKLATSTFSLQHKMKTVQIKQVRKTKSTARLVWDHNEILNQMQGSGLDEMQPGGPRHNVSVSDDGVVVSGRR
jgi:hypothetical protein